MAFDLLTKVARLIIGRRYTSTDLGDSQEAFTSTIQVDSSEVWSQASTIPTSNLPYSSSANPGDTVTSGSIKFWYRWPLTVANNTATANSVWYLSSPSGSTSGIGSQLIDSGQQINFISPKYSIPSLGGSVTDGTINGGTTGYNITLFTSSNGVNFGYVNPNTIPYAFDYKTGVVQFTSTPISSGRLYATVYQYIGQSVKDDLLNITSSVSASYALTASYALNSTGGGTTLITGSTYPITASWAEYVVSSSYSLSASYALTSSFSQTALSALSASYSNTSSYSITSSYALSSSFASTALSSAFAYSSSLAETASYFSGSISNAIYAISSSYSLSSSYASTALSSVFAYSSSLAETASYFSGSISDAINSISSSYSLSGSYALTASYALNGGSGGGGIFVTTSSIIDINISSSVDKFVTDGVTNTYTLTLPSTNPNDLLVFLDGLEQEPTTDYTVSGTTFTMISIPPANLELEVRKFYSSATISIITSSLNAQYFTGDGVTTQYSLTRSVSNDYDVLVSFDGLIQKPTYDYTITGSILNFTGAPPTNIDGEIRYLMGSTTGLINETNVSSSYALTSSYVNTLNQIVILSQVSSSLNFVNDTTAAAGGVPLGGLYRNGNAIQIRLV